MTNQDEYVTQRQLSREVGGAIVCSLIIGAFGLAWPISSRVNTNEKELIDLRLQVSNLTQRANFYHGTNWNYHNSTNNIPQEKR